MSVVDGIRAKILTATPHDPSPRIRGQWAPLLLSPDIAAGEHLNAGVVFFGEDGHIVARTTDRLDRLRCLFDDRLNLEAVAALLDYATAIVLRGGSAALHGFSQQVSLGPLRPAQGESAEAIVDNLFTQIVTLAKPHPGPAEEAARFTSLSSPVVSATVINWLRRSNPLLAQRIVADSPFWVANERNERQSLNIPLRRPGRGAGVIVSAWTRSQQTLELNLLRAGIDLATLHRHVREEQRALFVLRPERSDGLSEQDEHTIDRVLDTNLWQLRDDGVVIELENSVERLGQRIVGWEPLAA